MCPNFNQIFIEWTKFTDSALKINPKRLNKTFIDINLKEEEYGIPYANYNILVDSLLQISPSYNPEKQIKAEMQLYPIKHEQKEIYHQLTQSQRE